jgi:two-component system chemotaxis response regulator CheB
MPTAPVVVIGASAGGVDALQRVAAGLPRDFRAAVLVAMHLPEGGASVLSPILDRAGPLPAATAEDGRPLRAGAIVVAPPDRHLVVEDGRCRVVRGPKVNGHRPSIDVLFESAARSRGAGVIAVVLSGALSDGALGVRAVKRHGGRAVVQADAVHRGMPTSAMTTADVDAVVTAREIPRALTLLLDGLEASMSTEPSERPQLATGPDVAERERVEGSPSSLTCPECGGALWEIGDDVTNGYVCHVGHAFSADGMLAEQASSVERALWAAVRALNERTALMQRLAARMRALGSEGSAARFDSGARESDEQAEAIKRLLERPGDAVAAAERNRAA